jgi:hypothetical protein
MQASPDVISDGPAQQGRGCNGQYVYSIVMSHPRPETVQRLGLKTPADFDRESFRALVVACHGTVGVELVETACFLEPHANGLPHLNLLVRSKTQYKWKAVAAELRKKSVHVDFGRNIKTWADGVVYFCVKSEHKGEGALDKSPAQWVKDGVPLPLEEFLPARFRQPGFTRKTRMSALTFFDVCTQHNLTTSDELWAKAAELGKSGDRALLAYLLDNDGETQFAKVQRAAAAQERVRRGKLTREALLEEYVQKNKCTCASDGKCFALMKDLLRKNDLDGRLQREVFAALRVGRAKKRNVCLAGPADSGKSFLFKGLKEVFYTYERPDGGSYQLEDLLDKELVLLNDFEYDAEAKKWMPWQYFKNSLEGPCGGSIPVARPKNRGGNTLYKDTAPVLLTAPQEVTYHRYGKEVLAEKDQMDRRVLYLHFRHQLSQEEREEVTRHCGFCTAKLFLEGKAALDAPAAAPPSGSSGYAGLPAEPQLKRRRTAQECLAELKDLKELVDCGLLTTAEFSSMKERLLKGE